MKSIFNIILFSFFSCTTIQQNAKTKSTQDKTNEPLLIYVNYYKTICDGEGSQFCYLVKEDREKKWEKLFAYIEGFDYEWGHIYSIQILKEKNEFPSFNGMTHQYKLIKVLTKEPVIKPFELEFDGFDVRIENGKYLLINNLVIEFAQPDLKTILDTKIRDRAKIKALFRIGKGFNSIQLIELK